MSQICGGSRAPKSNIFGTLKRFCEEGELHKAIQTANILLDEGGYLKSSTILYQLIKQCSNKGNIDTVRDLHKLIVRCGFQSDPFLGNHLIRLFSASGSLREAYSVFGKLTEPNVFVWTSIISAHGKLGQSELGFELYRRMICSDVQPDGHAFVAALQICTNAVDVKMIHEHIFEAGLESSVVVANALIDVHMKCRYLEDAQRVFNRLLFPDVFSWTTLIGGYILHGFVDVAIHLLVRMPEEGIEPNTVTWNSVISFFSHEDKSYTTLECFKKMHSITTPDNFTFVSLLKSCTDIISAKEIHSYIVEMEYENDTIVINTLIDLYCKFGSLSDAYEIFNHLSSRSMVSWNALIAGYAHNGNVYEADLLFQKMQMEEVGCLDNVAWNVLIAGHAVKGNSDRAFSLYQQMDKLGLKPDNVTFLNILKACLNFDETGIINVIYSEVCEWELHYNVLIANTLIDVYAKSGSVFDARRVFNMLPNRSSVTWNVMITGYTQHNLGHEASDLFKAMHATCLKPDKFTYSSILKATSNVIALDQGKIIHAEIIEAYFEDDNIIWSALVDMYIKCGSNEDAQQLFVQKYGHDTVLWNAIISGHAQNDNYSEALNCYKNMEHSVCQVDEATYIALLSACGHGGHLEEAFLHFNTMIHKHEINPTIDHYNCLVDVLGRIGFLNSAMNLLRSIPFKENLAGWTSLLGHCSAHCNKELAGKCYEHLISCDPSYSSGYALMSSSSVTD